MVKRAFPFFLVLFFLFIFSLPVFWLVGGKPAAQVSIVEGRVLGLPEKSYPTLKIALDYIRQGKPGLAIALVWDLYTGGSLQRKFDSAAMDQFPIRMPLIMFSKSLDRQLINLAYAFTDDEVIPADMTSGYYVIPEKDAIIFPPFTLDEDGLQNIDQRLENYRVLISKFPDIRFNVFFIETLQVSEYHPLNKYFTKADSGQGFLYFEDNLPEKINLAKMSMTSLDDHFDYFFKTDHHWNTNGILKAYDEIYELLSSQTADFPPKLEPKTTIEFPFKFWGSLARQTLYPVKGDTFIGYEVDFPTCVTTDQGIEGNFDHRDEYHDGKFDTTPYIDHYELYFGTQKGLLEYQCETGSDQNILIIGDSYTRPLVALIASHYYHTYFIDPRQNEGFTLSGFLADHPVDDILFASDYEVIFMDTEQWMPIP